MLRRFFSSSKSNPTPSVATREVAIKSLIVRKQTQELCAYLGRNEDRMLCFEGFFQLLPSILDETYMRDLFEIMLKKSRLKAQQISSMITRRLSEAILQKEFDFCEKILLLPLQSVDIALPTYELIQLIHNCSQPDQLVRCLSILIQRNLSHDSQYLSWILLILFEHYQLGDEVIIEHFLSLKKSSDLLFIGYGNNSVTPLMLFLHLYSNSRCQTLIDSYLSDIHKPSVLLQCDKWNRSYLMHLLCGECQHTADENALQCPHTSAVLSRFSMLQKLGNRCDTPMKTILTSGYCLPLRMALLNRFLENDPSFEIPLEELFQHFPSKLISTYAESLKRLARNRNLNSALLFQLQNRRHGPSIDETVEFLLRQGARLENMKEVHRIIVDILNSSLSMIPFMLLDYSFYIDIPFDTWSDRHSSRMNLYICRVLQCGYPSEFRAKFDQFKSQLSAQTVQSIEKFIDAKAVPCLWKLCLQKLRSSVRHLGDETIDRLEDHLPNHLRQSITRYEYGECRSYFQPTVFFS